MCHPKHPVPKGHAICVVAQIFTPAAEETPDLYGAGGGASMKKGCCEVGGIVNSGWYGGALACIISC